MTNIRGNRGGTRATGLAAVISDHASEKIIRPVWVRWPVSVNIESDEVPF